MPRSANKSSPNHFLPPLNDAVEKAREMTGDGLKNVAITTQYGRVYPAADFPLLIKVREK